MSKPRYVITIAIRPIKARSTDTQCEFIVGDPSMMLSLGSTSTMRKAKAIVGAIVSGVKASPLYEDDPHG